MRLLVTTEDRFLFCQGHFWVQWSTHYSFWARYLSVFDEVSILSRALSVDQVASDFRRVDGERVKVKALPHYLGLGQYLLQRRELNQAIRAAAEPDCAYILRAPGQIANGLWPVVRRMGRPYGMEVVGDPWDVFAPDAVTHPLSPLLRRWGTWTLQRQCVGACAISYINSGEVIKSRYPAPRALFTTSYPSSQLTEEAFVAAPREPRVEGTMTIVSVMSFSQMYKAPDVMIRAVARLRGQGRPVKLRLVGGGIYLEPMRKLAASLGVADAVEFRGRVPAGDGVRAELDQADLFLLVSRAEGLGRALIEAMARGLPCIGSNVGGIPQLLAPEDLVPPGDHVALADKISAFLDDPSRRKAASERNLERAQDYREEVLNLRRHALFRVVREQADLANARRSGRA